MGGSWEEDEDRGDGWKGGKGEEEMNEGEEEEEEMKTIVSGGYEEEGWF